MNNLRKTQKRIQIIKYTLLLFVGCIIFLVLLSIFMVDSKFNENLISQTEKKQTYKLKDDCSLSINSSIIEGVNNDLPYRIEAKNIVKDRSNNYILEGVSCKYSGNQGDIIIDSEKGFLDEIAKKLFLNEEVNVVFNDMRLRSSHLHLDITTNDLKSDKPTIVDFKNSYIKANQVQTKNSTDIIEFKGGVKTVFDIDDF
ncbi:MAG: LPS export ABC transporter periplasmic protein LptC [Rickettsiales bacterium]|nr:MAG: LPS export ABC transporter periplasmic protein LptC [Rickettsiales bacterium]